MVVPGSNVTLMSRSLSPAIVSRRQGSQRLIQVATMFSPCTQLSGFKSGTDCGITRIVFWSINCNAEIVARISSLVDTPISKPCQQGAEHGLSVNKTSSLKFGKTVDADC